MALTIRHAAVVISCFLFLPLFQGLQIAAASDTPDANACEKTPAAAREDFNDEFNGTTLDPKWSWFNPPQAYDVGITTPGQLHMVSNNGCNFGSGANNGTVLYQNMSGSCVLETKVTANPTGGFEKTGIMFMNDPGNWSALKFQTEGNPVIEVAVMIGGSFNNFATVSVSPGTHYLRVIKDGAAFSAFYSDDGTIWNASHTWSQVFTEPFMAGLLIADGFSNANFSADYDYFHFRLPNRAPAMKVAYAPMTINEDEKGAIYVHDHFYDPDGDNLTFCVSALHIKGAFNPAINDFEIFGLPNWFGSENAYVRAIDPWNAFIEIPINVTVNSVEDMPILIKAIPDVLVPQNGTSAGPDLSKYFKDNDTPYYDALTYSFSDNGLLLVNIIPSGKVTISAPIDYWGILNVTFWATDKAADATPGTCKVMVQHVNQAPQVVRPNPPDLTVNEDETVSTDLAPVFWDPDGDPITLVPSGNIQIDVLVVNESLNITFKPKPDASGFYEAIKLTAKDDKGLGNNFVTVKVTVLPVNDPPRITRSSPVLDPEIFENQSQQFNVSASDADTGASLEFTWYLDGQTAALGVTDYFLKTDFTSAGNHTVMVSVSDGELFATRKWNVSVLNVNREPSDVKILSPAPAAVFREGTAIALEGSAQDPDGDALTYTWFEGSKVLGTGRTLSLALAPGPHAIVLSAWDGNAGTQSGMLHFTVSANAPPKLFSLDPINGQKFNKGAKIHFKAEAGDTDDDTLSYCWTEGGRPLSSSSEFYASNLPTGTHTIHLTISDGKASIETNLMIYVTEPATSGGTAPELIAAVGGAVGGAVIAAVVAVVLLGRRKPPAVEAARVEEPGYGQGQ
jgi:regulation of enolase protein 1 (concanavalin A-like superfamily)